MVVGMVVVEIMVIIVIIVIMVIMVIIVIMVTICQDSTTSVEGDGLSTWSSGRQMSIRSGW